MNEGMNERAEEPVGISWYQLVPLDDKVAASLKELWRYGRQSA